MIEISQQLREALSQQTERVVHVVDPTTQDRFVLLPFEEYDRLKEMDRHQPEQTAEGAELIQSRFFFDPIKKIRDAFDISSDIHIIPDAPDFAISTQGDIFRIHQDGRVNRRHFSPSKDGYVHYRIQRPDGSSKGGTLNSLVLQVFRPRQSHQGGQAKHKVDKSKLNNDLSNLDWGTAAENMDDRNRHGMNPFAGTRNPHAKLNDEQVREIKQLLVTGLSVSEIARRFGVGVTAIRNIQHGKTWKCAK